MDFPEFARSLWQCIGACATFQGHDKETPKIIADLAESSKDLPGRELFSRYGDPASPTYVSVFAGGNEPRHLHFDLTACSCMKTAREPNRSIDDLSAALSPLLGKIAEVNFEAGLKVPIAQLPTCGLVLGCKVESSRGVMKIKQSSASFLIERGPVDRIAWGTDSETADSLFIQISLRKITPFDRDFLTSFQRTANSVFDYLVLEKEINASRT
jgi:hypothetical protein